MSPDVSFHGSIFCHQQYWRTTEFHIEAYDFAVAAERALLWLNSRAFTNSSIVTSNLSADATRERFLALASSDRVKTGASKRDALKLV